MLKAAWTHGVEPERLRLRGAVDPLWQWMPLLAPSMFTFKRACEEPRRGGQT